MDCPIHVYLNKEMKAQYDKKPEQYRHQARQHFLQIIKKDMEATQNE